MITDLEGFKNLQHLSLEIQLLFASIFRVHFCKGFRDPGLHILPVFFAKWRDWHKSDRFRFLLHGNRLRPIAAKRGSEFFLHILPVYCCKRRKKYHTLGYIDGCGNHYKSNERRCSYTTKKNNP